MISNLTIIFSGDYTHVLVSAFQVAVTFPSAFFVTHVPSSITISTAFPSNNPTSTGGVGISVAVGVSVIVGIGVIVEVGVIVGLNACPGTHPEASRIKNNEKMDTYTFLNFSPD
jgi:hypothetical protein